MAAAADVGYVRAMTTPSFTSVDDVMERFHRLRYVADRRIATTVFLPTAGVCPAGTTQVHRVFSNRQDANHRYMTDK